MRLRHLSISNFRGIAEFDWFVEDRVLCLIGPGDSGKTTILDAIEWALWPRWTLQVSDADFHDLDVDRELRVEATLTEVPRSLLVDREFDRHQRFVCSDGNIHDEPFHDVDEPALTVRLTVDADLDPAWHVVCGDRVEPRYIGPRQRAALGASRLGGDPERHLRWARGSALGRLAEATGESVSGLAQVARAARHEAARGEWGELEEALRVAREVAPAYGAHITTDELTAGVDPDALSPSSSWLALHEGDRPLSRAGLGTRRLAALALQTQSVRDGALLLIDEVEQALEPHRLRRVLRMLRDSVGAEESGTPGQVFLTTHAPTTLVELTAQQLHIARPGNERATLRRVPGELQRLVRAQPEALLATTVIVGEGSTEYGLLRGLDQVWSAEEGGVPFAHRAIGLADGGGNDKAAGRARDLSELGYRTAVLLDSDEATNPPADDLAAAGVHVAQWSGQAHTEGRLADDLSLPALGEVLAIAMRDRGRGQVRGDIAARLEAEPGDLPEPITDWAEAVGEAALREAVGYGMNKGGWIKRIDVAEEVGKVVGTHLDASVGTDLHTTLCSLRAWADEH